MCRFIAYLGPPIVLDQLITKPRNSLIHQSFAAQQSEVRLNGDGFGLAWYMPEIRPEPALFRSVTPAWSNRNLLSFSRAVQSGCVLAHIRAASTGMAVTESNCHPFVSGRTAFMHNGSIGGFHAIRRSLRRSLSDRAYDLLEGSTDTEHMFAMFMDRLWQRPATEAPQAQLPAALRDTISALAALRAEHGATEVSYLNLAVTDGNVLAACRYTDAPLEHALSLYMHTGRYMFDGETATMTNHESNSSVLIASERLCKDHGWTELPVNQVVTVTRDLRVTIASLQS